MDTVKTFKIPKVKHLLGAHGRPQGASHAQDGTSFSMSKVAVKREAPQQYDTAAAAGRQQTEDKKASTRPSVCVCVWQAPVTETLIFASMS